MNVADLDEEIGSVIMLDRHRYGSQSRFSNISLTADCPREPLRLLSEALFAMAPSFDEHRATCVEQLGEILLEPRWLRG
jgi:hypothetical protein